MIYFWDFPVLFAYNPVFYRLQAFKRFITYCICGCYITSINVYLISSRSIHHLTQSRLISIKGLFSVTAISSDIPPYMDDTV